eukprot:m.1077871 g.1077871  ORF g.1077871 m.1077871 type:complete len:54 (-) comp24252_c0_seq2:2142-2303(-)
MDRGVRPILSPGTVLDPGTALVWDRSGWGGDYGDSSADLINGVFEQQCDPNRR